MCFTLRERDREICNTMYDMNVSNALDPDEFRGCFFKSCWDIIKSDLVAMVQHFFHFGYIPDNFNPMHLIVIPKMKEANRVEQYMPLALANFQFKTITNLLADRLALIAS